MSASTDLQRRGMSAIAEMEFRFGSQPWRAVLPGWRVLVALLGWVAAAVLLRPAIAESDLGLTAVGGLAQSLLLLGGAALCVVSPVWSWASAEPVGRLPNCGPPVGYLLPVSRRDRDLAGGLARLGAMLLGSALGVAMLLGAWAISRQGIGVKLSLRPLVQWALALGPAFVVGRIYQWAGRELGYRFSVRQRLYLDVGLAAVAYLCWYLLLIVVPGVWRTASAFAGACLLLALCAVAAVRTRAGAAVLEWCDRARQALAPDQRPAAVEAGPTDELSAPRPSRLAFELGWAFCPETGWPAWSRSVAVIFVIFAALGLLTAVGWPVLACALAGLRGQTPASIAPHLAWAPYAMLAILPGVGVGFSVAVSGVDFAPSRFRYARGLLPIAPRTWWRARLAAAVVYSLGFCLLAEACDLLGEWLVALMTHYWPQLPPERHYVALAMPALGLLAWAQGPVMRVPLRVICAPEVWGVLVAVAFFGVSAVVLGMAETHGFPLLAVIAWALALLFVPLSRLTIAPNAWPIRPDGRPAALTQVAAGLAVVASLPVSGLVLSATLLAGMVLMPP